MLHWAFQKARTEYVGQQAAQAFSLSAETEEPAIHEKQIGLTTAAVKGSRSRDESQGTSCFSFTCVLLLTVGAAAKRLLWVGVSGEVKHQDIHLHRNLHVCSPGSLVAGWWKF